MFLSNILSSSKDSGASSGRPASLNVDGENTDDVADISDEDFQILQVNNVKSNLKQ